MSPQHLPHVRSWERPVRNPYGNPRSQTSGRRSRQRWRDDWDPRAAWGSRQVNCTLLAWSGKTVFLGRIRGLESGGASMQEPSIVSLGECSEGWTTGFNMGWKRGMECEWWMIMEMNIMNRVNDTCEILVLWIWRWLKQYQVEDRFTNPNEEIICKNR